MTSVGEDWRPEVWHEHPGLPIQTWHALCRCGVPLLMEWSAPRLAWTVYHGENREHRRDFVTGIGNDDDWPLIRGWIDELHAYETHPSP